MTDKPDKFHLLDEMFAQARARDPGLPDGLLQRVLRDADEVQAGFAVPGQPQAGRSGAPGGWIRQISVALGGWAGLGGLATACAAGLWLGLSPPSGWVDPATLLYGSQDTLEVYGSEGASSVLALVEG